MNREPFHQGSLDSLCGLYALINASAIGTSEISPSLDIDARSLMAHLINDLSMRDEFAWTMTEGLTIPELGQLIKVTSSWLRSNHSANIESYKPFHCRTALNFKCVVKAINDHLGLDRTAVILMLRRPIKHWTVVSKVSREGLILCDSEPSERNLIRCAEVGIGSARKKTTPEIEIIPSSLFLLTFVPKEALTQPAKQTPRS